MKYIKTYTTSLFQCGSIFKHDNTFGLTVSFKRCHSDEFYEIHGKVPVTSEETDNAIMWDIYSLAIYHCRTIKVKLKETTHIAQINGVAMQHNTCRSLWKYQSNTLGELKVGQTTISSQLRRASKPL